MVSKGNATDFCFNLKREDLTESIDQNETNLEEQPQRFTSSLSIATCKTSNEDVSIILKSQHEAEKVPQRLYKTSLHYNTFKTTEGVTKVIIKSSPESGETSSDSPPRFLYDSSDPHQLDIEKIRLEKKRLEIEGKKIDAELMRNESLREAWFKKQQMELKKLELEFELRRLDLIDPKERKPCKIKVQGNLVKLINETSEIANSAGVYSSKENFTFSGEIILNAEQDIAVPFAGAKSDKSVEIAKSGLRESSERIDDENSLETSEDLTAKENDESLKTILRHSHMLNNLELTYGLTGHLIEDGVLNSQAEEDIQREGTTRYERCDSLLNYINDSNLEKFLDGLKKSMQSHLAAFVWFSINKTEVDPDKLDDWPLDEAERKTINKLYDLLVREMATNEMLDELLSEECLSELHKESIDEYGAMYKRNRELLDIVRRRSKKHVEKFWELVPKYSSHLKDIIKQFRAPGCSMTLMKINIKDNLTEEQKNKVISAGYRKNDDTVPTAAMEGKQINFCISGEEIYAVVPVEEQEVDSSSMIVSEEMKSLVSEALVSCTGDEVIVETLKNVEYKENISMDENDVEKRIFSLNTSTRVIQQNEETVEVTVVDDKIFVVPDKEEPVKVYNSRTLIRDLPDINIPDLKNPCDVTGCSRNKVLYISDYKLNCIHRVNITDNSVKRWSVRENYEPLGLSVTSEHNVLVTVWIRDTEGESRVVEYTSEGQLIREIKLDRSINKAHQTLELSTDRFIICHGWWRYSLYRVCVINSEGEIMKCFGGEEGEGEGQLKEPRSLTIDKNRQVVFVGDWGNDRVVMLDYEMNYLGLVLSHERIVGSTSVYYDFNSDQLIVGGVGDTRLLIISPKF